MTQSSHVQSSLRVLRFLFFVFLFQPLIFLFLLLQMRDLDGFNSLQSLSLTSPYLLLAILLFLIAMGLDKILLSPDAIKKALTTPWTRERFEAASANGRPLYDNETIEGLLSLTGVDRNLFQLKDIYLVNFVLRCVLFESCVLLGFIQATQTQNVSSYLPFLGLTYGGLLLTYPNFEKLKQLAIKKHP